MVPLYSVCVLAWIAWLQKNWTRQCKRLAFHWNSEDFEEEERARLGFEGPIAEGFYTPEGYWIDRKQVATACKALYHPPTMRPAHPPTMCALCPVPFSLPSLL
jgi:hypothetical protein